jgi:hypothetical protein
LLSLLPPSRLSHLTVVDRAKNSLREHTSLQVASQRNMPATLQSLGARGTAFKAATSGRASLSSRPQQAQQQRRAPVCHGLEPSVAAAVTQQAIAYAVTLGAEGAFSYTSVPAGDKGRPQVGITGHFGGGSTEPARSVANQPAAA